jgi:hypothetical protein
MWTYSNKDPLVEEFALSLFELGIDGRVIVPVNVFPPGDRLPFKL